MGVYRTYPVGLRLILNDGGATTWYDPTKIVANAPGALYPLAVANGDQSGIYHRQDSGFPSTIWTHGGWVMPANLGLSGFAAVTVRYAYSNVAHSVTDADGRAAIDALLNDSWLNQPQMRDVEDQTARYRYLRFKLGTDGGTVPSFVHEAAFVHELRIRPVIAGRIDLRVGSELASEAQLRLVAGDTLDLQLAILTSVYGAFDATGATVTWALRQSARSAPLLAGPVTLELSDTPEDGLAELHVPAATLTGFDGAYVSEFRVANSTVVHHWQVPTRIYPRVHP